MIDVSSPEKTESAAAALARLCRTGDCILLKGDLGSGKTTFARGFIRSLCREATEVVSPTFNLLQHYPLPDGSAIWHFDLYRLQSRAELQELGLEDALASGISLIEWPEMVEGDMREPLMVSLTQPEDHAGRRIVFRGKGARWQDVIAALDNKRVADA